MADYLNGQLVVTYDLYRKCEEPMDHNTSTPDTVTKVYDPHDCLVVATPLAMLVLYVIIGCVGIVGNSIVMIVFIFGKVHNCRQPEIRHNFTVWFILNQGIIDLMCSVFLLATSSVTSLVQYPGKAGVAFCKLWQTKVWLWSMMTSSTYNLLGLTLERYLKLQHPMWYRKKFSCRWALGLIIFAWCFGPALNFSYMIPTSIVDNENCYVYSNWPSETVRYAFAISLFIVQFVFPILCLVFGYCHIAYTLHKRAKRSSEDSQHNPDPTWQTGRNNTIKTLIMVAICFLFCWSCNQIVYLLNFLDLKADFASSFYHFTVIAVYLNCALNPIIYAFKLTMFKDAARDLHKRIFKKQGKKISETRKTICQESPSFGSRASYTFEIPCELTPQPSPLPRDNPAFVHKKKEDDRMVYPQDVAVQIAQDERAPSLHSEPDNAAFEE